MSQVFPFPCIGDQMALLFKDSISGTEEAVKLSDPHTNCTCMHKSKDQPVREEVPGLLTLNKFRSRCERGRFTQPMLLHAVLLPLHLAGLRRGLASYSDLFRHSDKLDDGLSLHFAHDLSAMHFDRDFTASQLTCDLLVKQTRHD
jgi:hypothetical protein